MLQDKKGRVKFPLPPQKDSIARIEPLGSVWSTHDVESLCGIGDHPETCGDPDWPVDAGQQAFNNEGLHLNCR